MDGSEEELKESIEVVTHSGLPTVNENHLKKLKSICKRSDSNVTRSFELLFHHLHEKHSEVRLSAFQTIRELFQRSHIFRERLIDNFQDFLQLTVGMDPEEPLPLPLPAARSLKKQSLLSVKQWFEAYGSGYPKLKLGYMYLKNQIKVNFDELEAENEATRRAREDRERRLRLVSEQRAASLKVKMQEKNLEIQNVLTQLENCFQLLLPKFDGTDFYRTSPRQGGSPLRGWQGYITDSEESSDEDTEWVDVPEGEEPIDVDHLKGKEPVDVDHLKGEEPVTVDHQKGEEPVDVDHQKGEEPVDVDHQKGEEPVDVDHQKGEEPVDMDHQKGEEPVDVDHQKGGESVDVDHQKGEEPVDVDHQKGEEPVTVDNQKEEEPVDVDHQKGEEPVDVDYQKGEEPVDVDHLKEEESHPSASDLQIHGIPHKSYAVSVEMPLSGRVTIQLSENNTSIISNMRDCVRQVWSTFLPHCSMCMQMCPKLNLDGELHQILQMKTKLLLAVEKYRELCIVDSNGLELKDDILVTSKPSSSVKAPPVRPRTASKVSTSSEWTPSASHLRDEEESADPTSLAAQLKVLKKRQCLEPANQLAAGPSQKVKCQSGPASSKVPVVPYDKDLINWEDHTSDSVKVPTVHQFESLHRFWSSTDHEVTMAPEDQRRVIQFAGKFEPIEHTCRAPLPNGRLCPRKDRLKCPFHGAIIPRDDVGRPLSLQSEDDTPTTSSKEAELWQDIQQDIERATGVTLGVSQKGKGKMKRKRKEGKNQGLTDLRKLKNTSRRRLEKIVFNKRSMDRVADAMSRLDDKRFDDKFGNNYNYALN